MEVFKNEMKKELEIHEAADAQRQSLNGAPTSDVISNQA